MVRAVGKLDTAVTAIRIAEPMANSPNDACWSNCNAKAECGKDAAIPGLKCPVNVCCSQYGFCGTTEDFCGTKCQSNCPQPGPADASPGDVQSRILGYYETWAADRTCSGMTVQSIPAGSLTHLQVAFGYIDPDSFNIVPMQGSTDIYTQITGLKAQYPGLKVIIALGGWSFNDNGTATQPVFSNVVSSTANRQDFIGKLLSFSTQFGFDGVDFDWEYPGAPDRGGSSDDGDRYTALLSEPRDQITSQGMAYTVSFTAPTSYWYLRHFSGLTKMMKYVDWMNLMSYDLHGVWDAKDPIGSHVLAHTNLTEIKLALDLMWRNDVPAGKINLGLGFYSRTFTLSDASCWQPGCLFSGGGTPGSCTDNSGTLSYKEITQVIQANSLVPYWDETDAVKYIVWNKDQWASYDDQDTFQQKIKYANEIGLGGLMIWAVDLDTDDLLALQGVLYPKPLEALNKKVADQSYWQGASAGDCRVTDCGGSCNPGEVQITTQPCENAIRGRPQNKPSALCCPLASAPDPKKCTWRGNYPFCNGQCLPGEVAMESNKWGDGQYCLDGLKFYCCEVPGAQSFQCRWADYGTCNSNEDALTYDSGGSDGRSLCCPQGYSWQNCAWHGEPGSCFDDHCDTGHQVSLATSYSGGGQDCGWKIERQRSYCCDPPTGASPFLPVPLEDLFPNPPPEDTAHTEFKLSVDPSFGGQHISGSGSDPQDASFGFFVMASPQEIQQTLRKRDGSHWELFDCLDSISEEEQTIRMVCSDYSESSNCFKIHLGYGVPGTILDMPDGCGPGKYAVAKDFVVSQNQTLPQHLIHRSLPEHATVYDLTFDYDFRRVPRDLGTTQWRLDYSNEEGYWNKVVDKAGDHKRKRSLDHLKKSHKRWLEEAWQDDQELSTDELHKRWFGSDIIDWLKCVCNGVTGDPIISHQIDETLTLKLIDETYGPCTIKGIDVTAKILVQAQASIQVDTNFGITIISTLSFPPDLSSSYLYFRNKGEGKALFTLDALGTASFNIDDTEIFGLDNFGATFSVPGVVTIGPNFRIFGAVESQVTIGAHLESQVNIAKWDVYQTYPVASSDWDPQVPSLPDRDGTQVLGTPNISYSVSADGYITGHIKPTFTFGIDFNQKFIPVSSCKVDLVTDGWIRLHASASTGSAGSSFCYGVDAGADVYASLQAPKVLGWDLSVPRYPLAQVPAVAIIEQTCPISSRDVDASLETYMEVRDAVLERHSSIGSGSSHAARTGLDRRGQVFGPLVPHLDCLFCPNNEATTSGCPFCDSDDEVTDIPSSRVKRAETDCMLLNPAPGLISCDYPSVTRRRDLEFIQLGNSTSAGSNLHPEYIEIHELIKRTDYTTKTLTWSYANNQRVALNAGSYPPCSVTNDNVDGVAKFFRTQDSTKQCTAAIEKVTKAQISVLSQFATEHVYEAQLLTAFLSFLRGDTGALFTGYTAASDAWVSGGLIGIQFANYPAFFDYGTENSLWIEMTQSLAGRGALDGLAVVHDAINGPKGSFFSLSGLSFQGENQKQSRILIRNAASVFQYLRYRYTDTGGAKDIWSKFTSRSQLLQADMRAFDGGYTWGSVAGELGRPAGGGMEDLYCRWIDAYLGSIEANARAYANTARSWFDSTYGGTPDGKNFVNTMMGGNGPATPGQMSLPTVAGARSRYGACL